MKVAAPQTRFNGHRLRSDSAFGLSDLLTCIAAVSVLAAIATPIITGVKAKSLLSQCQANLAQIGRALQMYADENQKIYPMLTSAPTKVVWWWYKESVKGYVGLKGPSSPGDKVFACPNDRGYEDSPTPFWKSPKFDFGSYCFNGINLPGVPNIAGKESTSITDPRRTLLVMEWTAHAPLSWHESKTGKENSPFYNNATSVAAFVDGHVALTRIYYDGINASYTRDPIPGYDYKYSPD